MRRPHALRSDRVFVLKEIVFTIRESPNCGSGMRWANDPAASCDPNLKWPVSNLCRRPSPEIGPPLESISPHISVPHPHSDCQCSFSPNIGRNTVPLALSQNKQASDRVRYWPGTMNRPNCEKSIEHRSGPRFQEFHRPLGPCIGKYLW